MTNELPKRKNIRLPKYDYSTEGYYFITICAKNKQNLLSEIKYKDNNGFIMPSIKLTNIGKTVEKELNKLKNHFNNIKVNEYIIMPNHIHFIIEKNINECEKNLKISNIIGLYKSGVSKKNRIFNLAKKLL